MRKNPKQMAGLAFLAILAFLAVGSPASAQITGQEAFNLFGTEYGDAFTSVFLNQIFGPLFPAATNSSTTTVFSSIIGYFNIIILVVGGLMFFYNVTVGVLQSSHEGSVLGQRWSSLWAPLRIIFAVGLMVPVPGAGGYNLSQTGVAYIVRGATNIASAVWGEAASLVISGATPITSAAPTVSPHVFKTLYDNAVCRAIVSRQLASVSAVGTQPLTLREAVVPGGAANGKIATSTYIQGRGSNLQSEGICGGYTTPELPAYINNIVPGADEMGLQDTRRTQIRTNFINTHTDTLDDLNAALYALVDANYAAALAGDPIDIDGMAAGITAAMQGANQTLETGMNAIMDDALGEDRRGEAARQALLNRITGSTGCSSETAANESEAVACYGEGWIGAGSWYMLMARLSNEVSSLNQAASTAEHSLFFDRIVEDQNLMVVSGGAASYLRTRAGEREAAGLLSQEEALRMRSAYTAAYEDATSGLAALGFPLSRRYMAGLMESSTDAETWASKIPGLREKIVAATEFVLDTTSPSHAGQDPMVGLMEIGRKMVGLGLVLIFALGASSFMGVSIAVMIAPFSTVLITSGGLLAFILPMLPFVYWIMAVTGYFLLIVEAVIAVNLWALSHMRMDGEGISGEAGRTGWLMLLSLMMTPVLMIFGFLIGMTIFRVSSSLLDIGIHQAIVGIAGSSIAIQLISIIIYGIMIAAFYVVVLERSFSLVSEFPGRVMRWVGAGAELTNNGEEQRMRGAAAATAGGVYGATGYAANGLAGVHSRRIAEKKQNALGNSKGSVGEGG